MRIEDAITASADGRPVLIAGPTACGKSGLALTIAERHGGTIINADALQVYARWRILTARPTVRDEQRAPHALYGHVGADTAYSVGRWLRDVTPLLNADDRPIIVGGTGLYLTGLTEGLADIPDTPSEIRAEANLLPIETLRPALDPATAARIDLANRARVQRAWEVLKATGRGLAHWQAQTGPALLARNLAHAFVLNLPPDRLTPRIERRFDAMLTDGAVDEARMNAADFDLGRPADRAIGAPELVAAATGDISLTTARNQAVIATRQYAKRQRTWFRARMRDWAWLDPD